MATIGSRIKELRNRLGLSQVEFAKRIGVSKQTLYKYENDIITNIPSDKIELISKEFDVSPALLMGWTDQEPEDHYYINDDAREYAELLFHHPEYKVLFDAARTVPAKDIDLVRQLIERFSEHHDD